MADPAHTPPGDTSFRDSLTRNALGAIGLVLASVLVFWGLSMIGGDDGVEVVDEPTDTVTEPVATQEPTTAPPVTSEPTAPPSPMPSPIPTPTATATSEPEPPSTNPTIQLIDAVLDDGGAAAGRVKSKLTSSGFSVRFETKSFRVHDTTKIWWTPGNETAANEIRAALGFGLVEPAPSNMSADVNVHVVVGTDA